MHDTGSFFHWGTQVEALVVGGLHLVASAPGEAINL